MRSRLTWLLVTVVACTLFASAGFWQIGRAHQKEAMLAQFAKALDAQPVSIDEALQNPDGPRPVRDTLTRRVDTPWLLLDNQRRGEAVGVLAFAVYESPDATPVVVNMGWLPLPPSREIPALLEPPATLSARGLLVDFPAQGLRLGDHSSGGIGAGPLLLTYLDPIELGQRLGMTLAPRMLRLAPDMPVGFTRDLDVLPNTLPAEQHYGYAFQWFGFAAAAACIFLILSLRTPRT